MSSQKRSRKKWLWGSLALFAGLVYLHNAAWLATPLGDGPVLLAHRGLGQDFSREGLTSETCTAAQMIPSGHDYLENTIASMQAAFDYGADIVEFDVHPTTDGRFAVFHDWTVDCRTEGDGVTRTHTLASLQALDIGYGYTADGGQTWPFRGKGIGLMPSLEEVLTTFPDRDFLIDIKGNDAAEGELLAERLALLAEGRSGNLMAYGGGSAINMLRERFPAMQTISRRRLKQCLVRYFGLGWTGHIPAACQNSVLMIPENVAPWLWGWPHRFLQRMDEANTFVLVIGTYKGEGYSQGFDDPASLPDFSPDYGGGIWTDRIDRIGPAVREGGHFRRSHTP